MEEIRTEENTAEYSIENYKFIVESYFDEDARKIDDILIDLAVNDLTKNETYCKIDL